MHIQEYIKTHRLLTDGAMGTYFEDKYQTNGRMAENFNLTAPEKVKAVHLEYIAGGAKLIRTNTFAANTMFFDDMEKVKTVIRSGCKIAEDAVAEAKQDVYIAADIGPIYDTAFLGEEVILEEYKTICDTFLACGMRIFVLETQSEFTYIQAVTEYLKEKADVYTIVQFSVDKSGYTRHGLSMEKIIKKAAAMDSIDAYGFNCGVGAAHLYQLLKKTVFPNHKPVTALPNAGYPVELRGKTVYGDSRAYFVEMLEAVAGLGIEILGGCCGTTPEYILKAGQKIAALEMTKKKVESKAKETKQMLAASSGASMNLTQKLKNGEKAFIVELDPPFDTNIEKVLKGAARLKEVGIDLLTLADSPMARARMDAGKLAAKVQSEVGISVMPHICCRDKNVIAMRSGMLGDYMNGLRHFLVVTGDPVAREARGNVTSVFDFNSIRFMEYLTEMNEDVFAKEPVCYGGALNYHGANPDAIIHRMQMKIDKGCQMFLTQPIYSKEDMERIAYIKEHIDAKIMCGIMPLVSYKNAMFMANEMPGIRIPEEIIKKYTPDMTREEAQQVGVSIAVEIADAMKEIADGYYFMTPFNRTEMIAEIITKIKSL
ncbi:MAG: bifunctional homocysteine S-methyltransferase/methylenetetrahydrofolate reductase [Lachnospiraceae bacterium]|nr:bifunctional homocysteine S-methyltransferase/methylenetetrahydrofolate reductase [Lachnospiraceae bacterium]